MTLVSAEELEIEARAAKKFTADSFLRHTVVPTIVLDEAFSICQISSSYLKIIGEPEGEILGTDIYDFLAARAPFVDPASFRKALDTATATRSKYILPAIDPDRRLVWNVRITPIMDGPKTLNILTEWDEEASDRIGSQSASTNIFNNDETYRVLVETVKDYAIFMLDRGGRVATWNLGAQLLKGYKPEEIIGRHFSKFYGLQDRTADKPGRELQDAVRDGKVEDEGWRYRRDGSKFWANVVITPVYQGSVLIGFSKVTRDLTERKAAEARLIAAYEESEKLKSNFLANMSHEIRTPMHGMLSTLNLLRDTNLNSEQLELAQIADESGSILLQIIDDILDYSKLAAGRFSLSVDFMNIAEIAKSVVRAIQPALSPRTTLDIMLDDELPEAVQGDTLRYRQILQNLVSNAVKFTERGSIQIRVKLQQQSQDSHTILTEVIDTGIGVDPDLATSLFTPFTQSDNTATKRFKGTGLGLSICKSLTVLMGGTIGFKPNPATQGSIFWFTVDMRGNNGIPPTNANTSETVKSPGHLGSAADVGAELKQLAQGKRLLLAEDNEINKIVMVKMLKNLGFSDVELAADGGSALEMAKRNAHAYDLILMDISMPVLDGVSVTQEMRKAGLQTPVIAMTANALRGDAEAYMAKGMNDYISKPVDRKQLERLLWKWI